MNLADVLREQLAEVQGEIDTTGHLPELQMMYKGEKIAFEYVIQLLESGVFNREIA